MATGLPKIPDDRERVPWSDDGDLDSGLQPARDENQAPVFALIERMRLVALTSPFWLAAILICLHSYGDRRVQAAIDFLTGAPGDEAARFVPVGMRRRAGARS